MNELFDRLINRIRTDARYRAFFFATANFIANILYAIGNFALGMYEKSYWFITAGAYYTILGVMRFCTVIYERRTKSESIRKAYFVRRFSGIMLILMSIVLSGSVYLSVRFDVSRSIHEIVMITIATYTFTKITLAIINVVKARKKNSPLVETLRNINLSDAIVSVFSMQRSMLVSFDGMTAGEIGLMNTLTGTGVCITVLALGINAFAYKRRDNNGKIENSYSQRKDSGSGSWRI